MLNSPSSALGLTVEPVSQAEFLKSQLATESTVENTCRAAFGEILLEAPPLLTKEPESVAPQI